MPVESANKSGLWQRGGVGGGERERGGGRGEKEGEKSTIANFLRQSCRGHQIHIATFINLDSFPSTVVVMGRLHCLQSLHVQP
jgi:hypothetical protein